MTMTPFLVAALQSMLSTPVPARPIIFKLDAAITSAVTFVAERTIKPSYFCNVNAFLQETFNIEMDIFQDF